MASSAALGTHLDIDLMSLALVLAVARQGSMAKAARQFGLSEPAVSLRIRKLEGQLGVCLFARSGRGAQLTPIGEWLCDRASGILSELEGLVREARNGVQGTVVQLVLWSSPMMLAHLLPDMLAQLNERHPEVRLVVNSYHPENLTALVTGDVDCAILPFREAPPSNGLRMLPIFKDVVGLAVAPACSLADRECLLPADLAEYQMLCYDQSRGYWPLIADTFARKGVDLKEPLQVATLDGMKELVKREMGISFFSQVIVLNEVEQGSLVFFPVQIDGQYLELPTWFCYSSTSLLRHLLRELETIVSECGAALEARLGASLNRSIGRLSLNG